MLVKISSLALLTASVAKGPPAFPHGPKRPEFLSGIYGFAFGKGNVGTLRVCNEESLPKDLI